MQWDIYEVIITYLPVHIIVPLPGTCKGRHARVSKKPCEPHVKSSTVKSSQVKLVLVSGQRRCECRIILIIGGLALQKPFHTVCILILYPYFSKLHRQLVSI